MIPAYHIILCTDLVSALCYIFFVLFVHLSLHNQLPQKVLSIVLSDTSATLNTSAGKLNPNMDKTSFKKGTFLFLAYVTKQFPFLNKYVVR